MEIKIAKRVALYLKCHVSYDRIICVEILQQNFEAATVSEADTVGTIKKKRRGSRGKLNKC